MELAVLNIEGKDTGRKVVLEDFIFGIEPNDHAIYLDVKQYLANKRQGTHKSKQRNEVSGSIKSPLFRGGGRVFGPVPRDYSFKLNKKVKQLARKSALTYMAQKNQIVVVEEFNLESPKTKEFIKIRTNLKVDNRKCTFVLPEVNSNVVLSARNIADAKVMLATQLNTYEIMNAGNLVISEGSVGAINRLFGFL
jgi:large subunit ribosomal protein L4